MANPELGAKQICPNCQTKFYDLTKRPATCPKCATSFDPEEAVRTRRVSRRAGPDYESEPDTTAPDKVRDGEDAEELEEEEAETAPEIDEAVEAEPLETDDADEPGATPEPDADIGVDFEEEEDAVEDEADDAVPFLEEEDADFPDEEIEGLPGEDPERG